MNLFYLNNIVLLVLNFNPSKKLSITLIVSVPFWLEGGGGDNVQSQILKKGDQKKKVPGSTLIVPQVLKSNVRPQVWLTLVLFKTILQESFQIHNEVF